MLKEKEWYQPGETINKFANVSITTTMEDAYELFKADSLIHRRGWRIRKDAAGATSWSGKRSHHRNATDNFESLMNISERGDVESFVIERNPIENNRCEEETCEETRPDKDELFEMLQDIEHVNPDVSTDDLEVQETVRLKRKKHPPRRYD